MSPLYIEIDITDKNGSDLKKKQTYSSKNLEFALSPSDKTPEISKPRPVNRNSLEPWDYGVKTPLRKSYVSNCRNIVSPREFSLGRNEFSKENNELKRQLKEAKDQIQNLKDQLEKQQKLREIYVCKNWDSKFLCKELNTKGDDNNQKKLLKVKKDLEDDLAFQKLELEAEFEAKLDSIKTKSEISNYSTAKSSMKLIKINCSNTASSNSSSNHEVNKLHNVAEEGSEGSEEIKLPKKIEFIKVGKKDYSYSSNENSIENIIDANSLSHLNRDELITLIANQKIMVGSFKDKSEMNSF